LLPDFTVVPGSVVDLPLTATDGSGKPAPLSLVNAPGFASLRGTTAAPLLHLAPTAGDARSCADVTGPGVLSTPAYLIGATAVDSVSHLPGAITVPVTVSAAPALNLSTAAVTLAASSGVTTPVSTTLTVSNTAGSAFLANVAITAQANGGWLQFAATTPTAGVVQLQLTANPTGLAVGAYLGAVTISAPGFLQPSLTVPVTLTVTVPGTVAVSAQTLNFNAPIGQDPAPQTLSIGNNGPAGSVLNWSAAAATTSGGPWLTVAPSAGTGAADVQVVVHSASLAAGSYNGSVTIASSGVPVSIPVILNVTAAASPVKITGVVNGGSFLPTIAASTWITIQGSQLASTNRTWTGADFTGNNLPTKLDDVSVTVNGIPAYIYFISAGQLNVLAPDDSTVGAVQVVARNSLGTSNTFSVTKNAASPAFFTLTATYPAAIHLNGVAVLSSGLIPGLPSTPALPGEIIEIYGTGFGPTTPAAPAGVILSGAASLSNTVLVTIGGLRATVSFAGLTGNGLDQLNVIVPAGLAAGNHAVLATVNGVSTQTGLVITVAPPPGTAVQEPR